MATARLSKKFYDKFGDDLTNELVDWFNQMESAYKLDLTTLNEANFTRFDARLEQRFAENDAKWERRFADYRVEFASKLADMKAELIKWMFIFWAGTTATVVGTMIALVKL